jgi:putative salt-induced outer membrane protein YdiY
VGVSLAQADVAAIRNDDEQNAYERLLEPGWTELWAGTGTVGLAGTRGNARTLTFISGVNAARPTNTDRASIYVNTIKASARINGRNEETAQAVRGGFAYDRDLRPRLFITFFNDYESDKFQNLDIRVVLGGGLGFHAIKNVNSRLDLLGGAGFNRSSFNTPATRRSAELYWGDEYVLKMNAATSLLQSFRIFHDVSNPGAYRMNFDLGLSTKLAQWLNWNVLASDRYLSHAAPGRKSNDLLYTVGLGFTFAR